MLKVAAPMAACAGPQVMVFPAGPGTCEKLGLQPLHAECQTDRAKVLRARSAGCTAIEVTNDCWRAARRCTRGCRSCSTA